MIRQSVSNLSVGHRHALLTSLSCLTVSEVSLICQEVVGHVRTCTPHLRSPHNHVSRIWVIALSKQCLSDIKLGDAYQAFVAQDISEYLLWLQLDAVSARATMNELNPASLHHARRDLMAVINLVKSYSVPISRLPSSCRSVVLSACCRLPLIEKSLNLHAEAVASFRCCVSADSALSTHLPVPYQIALCIEAGEMMLAMSCAADLADEASSDVEAKGDRPTPPRLEETQLHIDNAHSLLLNAKHLMLQNPSEGVGGAVREGGGRHGSTGQRDTEDPEEVSPSVALHPLSIHWLLPVIPSDADELVEGISSGRLAVSLAAASLKAEVLGRGTVVQEVVSLLEWGIGVETEPSLELLWNLGVLYVCLGRRVREGVELMCQCIPMSAALPAGVEACAVHGGSSIGKGDAQGARVVASTPSVASHSLLPPRHVVIEWLGMGPQPSADRSTLCAMAAAQVYLTHLGDPDHAIQAASLGLQCRGAEGADVIRAIDLFVPSSVADDDNEGKQPAREATTSPQPDSSSEPISTKSETRPGLQRCRAMESHRFLGSIYGPSPVFQFASESIQRPLSMSRGHGSLSGDHTAPSELYSLVLMIIRAYAAWARNNTLLPHIHSTQCDNMRRTALRLCRFLESEDLVTHSPEVRGRLLPSPMERGRLILELAVLLGEVGEISESIKLCKEYLQTRSHHDLENIPLLHLLAFLLTCTKGDEQVAAMAISVCSQALQSAEDMVHAPGSPHKRKVVKSKQHVARYLNSFDVFHTFTVLDVANIKLSLARIKWSVGSKEQAMRLVDEIVATLTSHDRRGGGMESYENRKGYQGRFDVLDHIERSALEELTLRVRLLTGASQLYRLVENFTIAQHCVEEAWRSLYSFHISCVPVGSRLHQDSIAQGGVAALLEKKNLTRPAHMTFDTELEVDDGSPDGSKLAADLSDVAWANMLREVPTISGWRLTEGTGWGAIVSCSLEAEILSECAEIAFSEGDAAIAMDLLSLALFVCPHHTRSMLCIASIELNALSNDAENNPQKSSQEDAQRRGALERAHRHCRMAVDLKKLSADAWWVTLLCAMLFQLLKHCVTCI